MHTRLVVPTIVYPLHCIKYYRQKKKKKKKTQSTVEPTLATVIATVRRYHRVHGRNKHEKHGLPGPVLQLGSQIKHVSNPSHFNVTLNDNSIKRAGPVKLLKATSDRMVAPKSNSLDVFMSVKTTTAFHKTRLHLLLHTWLQTVDPKQVDSQ